MNVTLKIFDDGSTDGTVDLVSSWKKHEQIQLTQNQIPTGSAANNFFNALQSFEDTFLDQYDYISFADQDDIWEKQKLSRLYHTIGSHSLIYADSQLIDDKGNELPLRMSDLKNQIPYTSPLMYTFGAWAPGHSMLFQKSILKHAFPFPRFGSLYVPNPLMKDPQL